MKLFKKRLLTVAIVISMLMSVASAAYASETSNGNKQQQLQEYSEQLQEAINEQESLQKSLDDAKALVKKLKNSKASAQENINKLNSQLNTIYERIAELEEEMEAMSEQIADRQRNLEELQDTIEKQYEAMKLRIKYIYENGNQGYLELILSAKDMGSMLNAIEYVSMLSSYDQQKMDDYVELKAYQTSVKEELEEQYASLEAMKADVEEQKEAVSVLISAKNQEIAKIGEEITDAQAVADAYAAEVKAQAAILEEIKLLIAQAANDGSMPTLSGGAFAWPCPGYRYVSSDYGPRTSPTAGASSNHKGVDLSAASGTAILAAESGIVSKVDRTGSTAAGKYLIVNHGKNENGVTVCTVYMHCSSIGVNQGDVVTRGQTIAQVGSTGVSTGPHLHFGVTENGGYVSPWNYVSKP